MRAVWVAFFLARKGRYYVRNFVACNDYFYSIFLLPFCVRACHVYGLRSANPDILVPKSIYQTMT